MIDGRPFEGRMRRLLLAGALAALSVLLPSPVPAADPAEEFTKEERHEIEKALDAKVAALLAEKDEDGVPRKRGTYSRSFERTQEGACRTTFHVDTASAEAMTTEREVLTLERDPDSRREWRIASEEVVDTYEGLIRSTPGDETFHAFTGLSLSEEGFSVTATSGNAYVDYRAGRPFRITVWAADLAYRYQAPLPQHRIEQVLLETQREKDLVFTPEAFSVYCDPATCARILEQGFEGLGKIEKDAMATRAKEMYEEFEKELREARKNQPFGGFSLPYEPEDRYAGYSVKKRGEDTYLGLEVDNREPLEVRFWASGYGIIFAYNSEPTRQAGEDPYALETRLDADARDYELETLKGTVEMGFGDGELLEGDLVFGVRMRRPAREIRFRITRLTPQGSTKQEIKDPEMRVNSVRDGSGRELTWVRTGLSSGLVVFPEEVAAGSLQTLHVEFENQGCIYKFTPSYSYVARGGWLPFVRFGDMIDEFDLTVKVPAKYTALGIGEKVSESKADGVSTTRWVAHSPVEFPTVIYGQYQVAKSTVKATKKDGTEIPVTMHVDKVGMAMWEIAPKALTALADEAANALNLYREVFGVDYPYAKLDLVNDPLGGLYGQAPSSIVYLGSETFWSKGVLGSIGGSNYTRFAESVVAHEVGHQWWGSVVSNANQRNYWFVESLAEYASSLFMEAVNGKKGYLDHVEDWRRRIMDSDLIGSVQDAPIMYGGERGAYQVAVYSKGPYAFHIMRSTWGDEKFFQLLKALAGELKGREIVTRDIEKVAAKVYGIPMDWFFDQWIRGVGIPEYTMEYHVSEAESGTYIVEGEISQVVMTGAVKAPVPGLFFQAVVPLTVEAKDGHGYRKALVVSGPSTKFRLEVPAEPKKVILNQYGEALAYDVVAEKL